MARRTAEETRALLLDEGVRLLLERGVTAGVQHIRLQEVLRNVGLTTGAAYRIWSDQTDFQRDLAVAMVRLRLEGPVDGASSAVARLLESDVPDDEIIRAASATHVAVLEQYRTNPSSQETRVFVLALALRMTSETWPELHAASLERHAESVQQFAAFYLRVAQTRGYRMRTPYTLNDFAEAMAALGEGFAIRAAEGLALPMLDIGADDEAPTGRWSLFGVAVRGLVHEFMVKDDTVPTLGR